ncbi:hypothetical protein HDV05_007055 [Chytridiales sp. JEL 0842]|nr:hypothetical protein HDV05_007055 [Chytridiales sp. JEL 0842]
MYMTQKRQGARGDKVRNASKANLNASLSKMTLTAENSATVRQRVAEAKRSGFLDLSSLGLSMLPEGVAEMGHLSALMLGNNNFTSVPSNISENFPNLVYLDLSDNEITSIPSSLAELEELRILDLSGNEGLEGVPIPSSFGPRRTEIAVFVDNEPDAGIDEDDEDNTANLDENGDAYSDSEDEEEEEDDENLNEPRVKQVRDHAEDVALESLRFFRRLAELEDAKDLESTFRRLLASKDTEFIKYLLKRYSRGGSGSGDDDEGSEEDHEAKIAKRKNMKEQIDYARKEKERFHATEKSGGRKAKDSLKWSGDY